MVNSPPLKLAQALTDFSRRPPGNEVEAVRAINLGYQYLVRYNEKASPIAVCHIVAAQAKDNDYKGADGAFQVPSPSLGDLSASLIRVHGDGERCRVIIGVMHRNKDCKILPQTILIFRPIPQTNQLPDVCFPLTTFRSKFHTLTVDDTLTNIFTKILNNTELETINWRTLLCRMPASSNGAKNGILCLRGLQLYIENESHTEEVLDFENERMSLQNITAVRFDLAELPASLHHPLLLQLREVWNEKSSLTSVTLVISEGSRFPSALPLAALKTYVEMLFADLRALWKFNNVVVSFETKGQIHTDVNHADEQDISPLSWALATKNAAIVQRLLELDVHKSAPQKSNELTALHIFSAEGNQEIVSALLGPEDIETRKFLSPYFGINLVDEKGLTPLHHATQNNHIKVVQLLLRADCINAGPLAADGSQPIHYACQNGHTQLVDILIRAGASCFAQNANYDLPVHFASANGHIALVAKLLEQTDNAQGPNSQGRTPLHLAAIGGHVDLVEYLLSQKFVDVNLTDTDGKTALHCAAEQGHLGVAQLLAPKCNGCNQQDLEGNTPLHYACDGGHHDVRMYLMAQSSVKPVQNYRGEMPHDLGQRIFPADDE